MLKHTKRKPWTWVTTLYFAEGIPYVAVMTVAMVMYKQMGLNNAQITLYTSWMYLPWVIKPLWSPFVEVISTKRRWITTMQLLIGAALAGVAYTIPTAHWLQGTLCGLWLLAFAGATHDVAADGFYMLALSNHEQAWYVGIRSTCYRIATIVGQGVLIMIAGKLQGVLGNNISYAWSITFYGLAGGFIALWLWHSAQLPHPQSDEKRRQNTIRGVAKELLKAIKTFFQKEQMAVAMLFMLLFRMPEGLLIKVAALFLIDDKHNGGMGLSTQEYGFAQGTVGVLALTIGGILGGIAASKNGLKQWLWPMVAAISIPDLVYVFLAYAQTTSIAVISVSIFIEQFGYGFGFTAYMLYLLYYSRGKYQTAHYALCTALMAMSLMLPGLVAGTLQEAVGYTSFFIIVCASCALTALVAARVNIDPAFGKRA